VGLAGGHSIGILARRRDVTLPPGQHLIDGVPALRYAPCPARSRRPHWSCDRDQRRRGQIRRPATGRARVPGRCSITASTRRPHSSRGPRV